MRGKGAVGLEVDADARVGAERLEHLGRKDAACAVASVSSATFANATTLIFDVERYNIALKYCSRVSNAWTTIRDATTMDVVTYEKDRVNTPPRVMMAANLVKVLVSREYYVVCFRKNSKEIFNRVLYKP